MNWLVMIGIAVALIAVAAVLGSQPKGARPVARTHLMGVARFVLLIFGLILIFLAFRYRGKP
ncbi:MAG: hypothetical protein ACRD16_14725 [Thermoanaerobaculia bacterium]